MPGVWLDILKVNLFGRYMGGMGGSPLPHGPDMASKPGLLGDGFAGRGIYRQQSRPQHQLHARGLWVVPGA